jgi:uncharacterized spore protein YtfJ
MDDQSNLANEPEDDFDEYDFDEFAEDMEPSSAERLVESIESNLDHMLEVASVEAVYGAPIKQRDTLIIPVAEVSAYMGFGMGIGSGSGSEAEEENAGYGEGGGGGGGGFSLSRPVAVIVCSPEGVRVEPVVDPTKIAIAALTAGAFMFSMLVRMGRMRRQFKALERGLGR